MIDGTPDSVSGAAEVVVMIREQQDWADQFFAERRAPRKTEVLVPGRSDEPQRRPSLLRREAARPARRAGPPPRRPECLQRPSRNQPHPPVPARWPPACKGTELHRTHHSVDCVNAR